MDESEMQNEENTDYQFLTDALPYVLAAMGVLFCGVVLYLAVEGHICLTTH